MKLLSKTGSAKADFTEDDVYEGCKKVIERAITFGTMHMRTHVEIDPDIGLTGFQGIRRLQLAERYDCDMDMHLDFGLDPEGLTVPEVIRCTLAHGSQNRVTIGHVTKLAALAAAPARRNLFGLER